MDGVRESDFGIVRVYPGELTDEERRELISNATETTNLFKEKMKAKERRMRDEAACNVAAN